SLTRTEVPMTPEADATSTPTTQGSPRRLERLVARRGAANPDACAVQDRDGYVMSYGQLWDDSGRLAGVLARMGIGRRSVVAIALDRSAEMVVAVLGVVRTGAAYVLLDPQSPPARNALIVTEVAARAIVEGTVPAPWSPTGPALRVVLPLSGTGPERPPAAEAPGDPEDPLYIAYTSGSTGHPKGVIASHQAVAHFSTESSLCAL